MVDYVIAEGITESPAVASAVAYFITAAAGALTLYATTHWSSNRRNGRNKKERRAELLEELDELEDEA